RNGLSGCDTQACSGMVRIGRHKSSIAATPELEPATAWRVGPACTVARLVSTANPRFSPFGMAGASGPGVKFTAQTHARSHMPRHRGGRSRGVDDKARPGWDSAHRTKD